MPTNEQSTSAMQEISCSTSVGIIEEVLKPRFGGLGRAQSRLRGLEVKHPGKTLTLRRPHVAVASVGRGLPENRHELASDPRRPRENRLQCNAETFIQTNQLHESKGKKYTLENCPLKINSDPNEKLEHDVKRDDNVLTLSTSSKVRSVSPRRDDPYTKNDMSLETLTEPIPSTVNNKSISVVRNVKDCTSLESESKSKSSISNTRNHDNICCKRTTRKISCEDKNIQCNSETNIDVHIPESSAEVVEPAKDKTTNGNQKKREKTGAASKSRTFLNGAKSTLSLRNAIYTHLNIRPVNGTSENTKDAEGKSEEEENWDGWSGKYTEPSGSASKVEVSHHISSEGTVYENAAFSSFPSGHGSAVGGSTSPKRSEYWDVDKRRTSGNVECCRPGRPTRRANRTKKDQPMGSPIRIIRLAAPEEMPTTLRDLAYIDNSPVDVKPELPSLLLRCMIGK